MKHRLFPLLLGLVLTLAACKPATDQPTPTPPQTPVPTASATPSPTPTATVAPAPIWGEQDLACTQPHPDKPEVTLVAGSFHMPFIENADGFAPYTAINDYYARLLVDLKSDTMGYVAQARDDYETAQALGDGFSGYTDEETALVAFQSEAVVSVLRTHYGHADGPYPTLLYMSDHFDLKTGQTLHFSDFFTDGEAAAQLALAEILTLAAADEQVAYDSAAVTAAFQREYFYLTEDGFVFFYQPQVLTPMEGFMPSFTVAYDVLDRLMQEQRP